MPPTESEFYPIGLSVIVPAYNEEALLKGVVEHLVKTIPGLGLPAEIIIVDDGSLDGTPALADELAAAHDVVSVHHHQRNQGFGATFRTGLECARLRYVMYTPADYNFSAKEFDIYLTLIKYADVVIGYRRERRKDLGVYPWLISVVYHRLVNLTFGLNFYDVNWLHMYRRDQVLNILGRSEGVFLLAETLIRARRRGLKIIGVDVDFIDRTAGTATSTKPGTIFKTLFELFRFLFSEVLLRKVRLWYRPHRSTKGGTK